jgi:hypothetical protein
MDVKWMVFHGAFNADGASASSSPIWMVGVVDSIVGDLNVAFVGKVCLRDEHDVNVAQGKKCFQFLCVVAWLLAFQSAL